MKFLLDFWSGFIKSLTGFGSGLIKSLTGFWSGLIKSLTGFLFPQKPRVLVLEALTSGQILKTLPPAVGPEGENVIALFDYSHPVTKEIVWEIKYAGNRVLAKHVGEILYDFIIDELDDRRIFSKERSIILIPMPISDKRRFERGWNQAELLAKAIKKCDTSFSLKYLPGQLIKTIHTESQTRTSSKKEREQNLANTMRVFNPLSVKDRFVVLIDDVTTTGSTFTEARRALKAAGVKKILCIALAH